MKNIEKVMSSYGVKPVKILKISDRVHKIDDGQHQYSLKKSVLTHQSVKKWEQVFHHAQQHQLSEILSIFVTIKNSFYTISNDEFYYLMPWIDGKTSNIKQLYRSIGKIHQKTRQPQLIDYNQMRNHFTQYGHYCDEVQKKLLTYVKQFESHIYMSPLELQVCTHYRDLELATKKAQELIRQLSSSQAKQKNWDYSLCHGNLRLSHSLIGIDNLYFINWEQVTYNYPATDLFILFKNELINYDAPTKLWIHSFKVYMEENQLQNDELSLLLIYLLDLTTYLKRIQQYIDQISNQSIINQIRKLQIEYRRIKFGLQFAEFISQNYFSMINPDLED